jgi:putative Mn2+ efflux pump MntP
VDLLTLFLIALGLTADSFAVSVSSGIILNKVKLSQSLKIAFFLAFFQGIMPVIGWALGFGFKDMIKSYDHWVAFSLLFFVGAKMIWEGYKSKPGSKRIDPTNTLVLILMAIATSIDALIVGLSFAFMDVDILFSSVLIGLMTFTVSMAGIYLGCKFCRLINYKLDVVAGFVLIGIGIKIMIEHLE